MEFYAVVKRRLAVYRYQELLNLVKERGKVTTIELAAAWDLSLGYARSLVKVAVAKFPQLAYDPDADTLSLRKIE